jgi:drug/metabolite transporter (DMT)-like permease
VLVAAAVVTAGAGLVEGAGATDGVGVAWAAVALACEAGFTLLAVPVLPRHGAWGVSVHAVWIGALMFVLLGAVAEGPTAASGLTATDLLAMTYLAVMVTAAAFVLWYSAVAGLGAARAGLLTAIAPISAALSGIVIDDRVPGPFVWVGMAVVLAGLAAGLRGPQRAGTTAGSSEPMNSRTAVATAAGSRLSE